MSTARRPSTAVSLALLAGIAVAGLADRGRAGFIALGAGLAVATLGLVIISGWARQVSLCQYGFMGIGAFAAAGVDGQPFPLRLAAGGLVAAGLAVPVGLAAARLRGLALGALTLLVGLTVWSLSRTPSVMAVVGGDTFLGVSVTRPSIATDDRAYAAVALAVGLAALAAVAALARTRTGTAIGGLGSSPAALAASGWSPLALTVTAFAVSAGLAGLGGVVVAAGYGSLNGNDIVPFNSVVLWALLFNLGARRPAAAWLAAATVPAAAYLGLGGSLLAIVAGAGLVLTGTRMPAGALAELDRVGTAGR